LVLLSPTFANTQTVMGKLKRHSVPSQANQL